VSRRFRHPYQPQRRFPRRLKYFLAPVEPVAGQADGHIDVFFHDGLDHPELQFREIRKAVDPDPSAVKEGRVPDSVGKTLERVVGVGRLAGEARVERAEDKPKVKKLFLQGAVRRFRGAEQILRRDAGVFQLLCGGRKLFKGIDGLFRLPYIRRFPSCRTALSTGESAAVVQKADPVPPHRQDTDRNLEAQTSP
jgi:hypothetical protein